MNETLVIVGPGRLGRSATEILSTAGTLSCSIGRDTSIPSADITWLTVPDREVAAVAQDVPPGGRPARIRCARYRYPEASSIGRFAASTDEFPGPERGLPLGDIPAAIAGDEAACVAARRLALKLGFTPFTVAGDRRSTMPRQSWRGISPPPSWSRPAEHWLPAVYLRTKPATS